MNRTNLYQKLSEAAALFSSRKEALPVLKTLPDWNAHTERGWTLLYDEVFRGTNAFWQIPLWASTALGERALCNQTTLDVIRFYHRFGYAPVRVEGNPPDYIGEQLLFLLYLARASKAAEDPAALTEAAGDFIDTYTLTTAAMISRAAAEQEEIYDGLKQYLKDLVLTLSCEDYPVLLCADAPAPAAGDPAADLTPIPDEEPRVVNTGGLNNCGGICVIRPTVQENCILRIESDVCPDHAPQIRACVRGRGYRKTFLHPGRLRYPMRRAGKRGSGHFERISWEEAVDELVKNWVRIRDTYGPASRFQMYGTGVTGIFRPTALVQRLLSLDGGYLGAFNSYSSACTSYIAPYLFGSRECGHSAADLLNTKLLILWADNTAESIFGPERNYYLSLLKEKGVRIICIDPRLSQTGVAYADEWYAVRPSTDAALADAMAYVIWSEGLQDQAFMDRYCLGFDEAHMPEGVPFGESYHSYLFGLKDGIHKTPEWAEAITGIEADRIRHLARLYATTKPAAIHAGLGAQRHGNGEQTARGISMLTCLTGNLGRSGGGNGGNTSAIREHEDMRLFTNTVTNPYPGMIPNFLWSQAVERGTEFTPRGDRLKGVERLESNIKMIFCTSSNTLINQHSDVNETIRILEDESKCEFIVCSDIFMTPSARFADLVLPATSVFEGENIVHSWAGSNYLLKNNPVIDPLFECRFEWDWLKEVSKKLGLYEAFTDGKPDMHDWLTENYGLLREKEPELPDYGTFSAAGGYQFKNPVLGIPFKQNIEDPEHHPFNTPSGKIEIFSKRLYDFDQLDDIPAIPKYVPCPEGPEDPDRARYPLQMIGWHTRRRCHSIHDNNEWQDEVESPILWIHPQDAAPRGIRTGDTVEVFNDRGRVRISAVVTDRICTGACAMPQGAWFTPDRDGTDVRGCINTLTSHRPTPLAKGNPQHTNLVEVEKA